MRAGLLPWSAPALAAAPYLRLGKLRIAALSTLSAGAAYCLAAPRLSGRIVLPLAGLFLLACGSGALNQCQERELDARMPRTRRRPLPAGEIRPREAYLFAASLMLPGLFLLQHGGGNVAALLGLAAVVWYNGVYTCLKQRTAFAFLPGALVGAIPPAIGWVSGGGALADTRLPALCGLLFLWQVPHFGLLLLTCGGEFAGAGLPVVSNLLPRPQLARMVTYWLLAAAIAGSLLPLPEAAGGLRAALVAASLALAASGPGIFDGSEAAARRAFHAINAYLVLVLVLVAAAAVRFPPAAELDNHPARINIAGGVPAISGLEGLEMDRISRTSLAANRRLFP
jgi:heme o synthase